MALDHYVSQVHLRKFYSPALNGLMYAIRKSDLKRFRTNSESVCRIEEGSTNAYLMEDRVIEDFLKDVEPRYNASIEKLRERKIDQQTIYCIAGFATYIAACSPTAMRLGAVPLKSVTEQTAARLDQQGMLPKAPAELGGKSLTELLEEGSVTLTVDTKYPQAIGISQVLSHVSAFGNSTWEILHNHHADSPFFTSDFPAAIEGRNDVNVPLNRIVPLAPDLAVRIWPRIPKGQTEPDLTFADFRSGHRNVSRSQVANINRLIVQCAEDLVFFRDDEPWIERFVTKHSEYRVEAIVDRIPSRNGMYHLTRLQIWKRPPSNDLISDPPQS